jgi:hypothetical protein
MIEAPAPKSYVMTWVLSILGVLVFYVLSWGPVAGMLNNKIITYPMPRWATALYQPLFAALQLDAFQEPMEVWCQWWTAALKKS